MVHCVPSWMSFGLNLSSKFLLLRVKDVDSNWDQLELQTYWKNISGHFNTAEVLRMLVLAQC